MFAGFPPAATRLRASREGFIAPPTAFAKVEGGLCLCSAAESTRRTLQSDEPFTLRDIQFDDPDIGILIMAPFDPVGECARIIWRIGFGQGPAACSIGPRHPLVRPRIAAASCYHNDQGARLALTLGQHRGKSAGRLNLPQ